MGCHSSKAGATAVSIGVGARSPQKARHKKHTVCLLGCDSRTSASVNKTEEHGRDYSLEPMFAIFRKHDTDDDGYLQKGQLSPALADAGIQVADEDLAFEWLDRNFENSISYKEFRRASEKSPILCSQCQYQRQDSSDFEYDQDELLRTYWRKFDPERKGWCYADIVIDYLAGDWGIQVEPQQRVIENKLMGADIDGKIVYTKFKHYFTSVPEDDLKHRVSSSGGVSNMSLKNFERQLDDMLLS